MRLWIETACQSLIGAGEKACGDAVRTLQTEDRFFAVLVSGPQDDRRGRVKAVSLADQATSLLGQGTPLERVVEVLLATLPNGEYVPFSRSRPQVCELTWLNVMPRPCLWPALAGWSCCLW